MTGSGSSAASRGLAVALLVTFAAASGAHAASRRAAPVRGSVPAVDGAASLAAGPSTAGAPAASGAGPHGGPITAGEKRTIAPVPVREAARIVFASGLSFDTQGGEPPLDPALRVASYGPGPAYYVVQFRGPITPAFRRALESAGGHVVAYQPHYAYLVRADEQTMGRVRALPEVAWTGLYQPAYKLSPALESAPANPVEVKVLLFPDEDLAAARAALERTGARVIRTSQNRLNTILHVSIPREALASAAAERAVQWIEPFVLPAPLNANAQWITQSHVAQSRPIWGHGLRGDGQILSTSDTGVRTSHNQFRDPAVTITSGVIDYPTHRKIIAYRTLPGAVFGDDGSPSIQVYHGTHTAGTACGDDSTLGVSLYDGLAIHSRLYFCDIGSLGQTSQILTGLPLDLNDLFIYPYTGNAGGRAFLMSNSWGAQGAGVYGVYDLNAMQADQFMWDHKDFLLFFSNGNAGPSVGTVLPPATAKDIVSVGGTDDTNGNTYASSSSRGNTLDGRVKPTVVTPGFSLWSAFGKDDLSYQQLGGTSMSSPAAMGSAALIRQYLTEGWYPSGAKIAGDAVAAPSAALMKALLVNSADPGPTFPGTDFGWGRVDVDSVLFFAGDTRGLALVENAPGLVTGDAMDYHVTVGGSTIPLKITLVWTDYPGAVNAGKELVNDLNLTVIGPGGTYLGNVFSGGQSTTGGAADAANVEEWVRLNAPAPGDYTIRVAAANVPIGPQPFALAVTGSLVRTTGLLALDKAAYGPTDVVHVRLEDTTPGLSGPSVRFTSTSRDTETVVLTGRGGGVFDGSLSLSFGAIRPNDGTLAVSNGDIITATYVDANTMPATIVATALVDATTFRVADVRVTGIVQSSATVTWYTPENATSRVYYGTTPALGLATPLDAVLVTAHAVRLAGLLPGTTYYYDVESEDARGNIVRDDNGGRHYTFTTGVHPDVFLVIGDSSFPDQSLNNYFAALARRGWSYDYTIADVTGDPPLGDATAGLRSYPLVLWNAGEEQYPPVSDTQTLLVKRLHDGGGRFGLAAHDVVWDFMAPASQGSHTTPDRVAWVRTVLHEDFKSDPQDVGYIVGLPGDPISGAYTGGILYEEARSGGAADEVHLYPGSGSENFVWVDDTATSDSTGIRWTSSGTLGTPDSAAWGGQATKVAVMNFEPMRLNWSVVDDAARADVVNKVLLWLTGRDHPTATVTSPAGGTTVTTASVPIAWTAAAAGGFSITSTTLQFSQDFGQSWTTIASGAVSSPYTWSLAGVLNSPHTRVRVLVTDSGSPGLHGSGQTGDFAIARTGGDFVGPVVVAGTPMVVPNPANHGTAIAITASLTDTTAAWSNIHAAEYSFGGAPAPAGTGTPMTGLDGAFDTSPSRAVTATAGTAALACSTACVVWIRGQDQAGNWGAAQSLSFVLRMGSTDARGDRDPAATPVFALRPNVPNPFRPNTLIRFSLAHDGFAALRVYDVRGSLVRTLVGGVLPAGAHAARWDGTDARGRPLGGGVYFYRLEADGRIATRKLVKAD